MNLKTAALGAAMLITGAPSTATAEILVMGGNPEGSLFYAQSQAIASVIGQHTDDRVDVLPQSPTVFFPMFVTAEADFGLSSPIEADFAYRAIGPYEGAQGGEGYPLSTIMLGSPISLSLVVRGSSDIHSLADLEGRRVVADYGAFAGSSITAEAALANAGLGIDDITVVSVSSYPEGVTAVIEGRADAAVGSLGSGILQQLNAAEGARILSIDPSPEAMARSQEVGSSFVPIEVPAGPVGVDTDIQMLSYATTLYSRSDLSDETVKSVLHTLWEHSSQLETIHPSLATWTRDRFVDTAFVVPFHPAAIEFYREKGVWTDELEARQAELLAQ
ncbi:TAXI family TRAP transporter solute-binding subunit [Mesorhizobium sp. YIM 152430]|nr:TAXI family TRAP transporter solute-binding subunit [Mesorhizobium sp. YIM 152430]